MPLVCIEGVDVSSRDNKGNTAIIIAAGRGRTQIIKLLLSYGANPEDSTIGSPPHHTTLIPCPHPLHLPPYLPSPLPTSTLRINTSPLPPPRSPLHTHTHTFPSFYQVDFSTAKQSLCGQSHRYTTQLCPHSPLSLSLPLISFPPIGSLRGCTGSHLCRGECKHSHRSGRLPRQNRSLLGREPRSIHLFPPLSFFFS